MLVVRQGGTEGIVEDGDGLIEADAVLLEVASGFGWIELEAEAGICHALVVRDILARGLAAGGRKAIQSFRAARCTPAFGRAVRVCDPGFLARVNACPSGGWRLTQVSEVARKSVPTSQKRDVGHAACIIVP